MPPFTLIKFSPLSLKSVQLGRLVFNTTAPGQDFIDPFDGRPTDEEFTTTRQKDFECTRKFSKKSGLLSYLNAIVPLSHETETEHVVEITAPEVTTLELMNSGSWFKDACGQKTTHEWLESKLCRNSKVYLVVGYRALRDAKVVFSSTSKVAKGTKAEVPTQGVGVMADLGVWGNRETIRHENDSFDSPDEQIFEVEYRRVKFKRLASRKISNASLEANQWRTITKHRSSPSNRERLSSSSNGERQSLSSDSIKNTLEMELTDSSDLDTEEESEAEYNRSTLRFLPMKSRKEFTRYTYEYPLADTHSSVSDTDKREETRKRRKNEFTGYTYEYPLADTDPSVMDTGGRRKRKRSTPGINVNIH